LRTQATAGPEEIAMLMEIITGTTREGRFSEKVASWVERELKQRTDFDVETVDLRDHPLTATSRRKTGSARSVPGP
jgi:NAD(P)H-dependent FMN reductase